MRIIGYIEHPVWKITVFKTDTRLSVKFEDGLLEQTYKFVQQEHLHTLSHLQQLVDESFLSYVGRQFLSMDQQQRQALERHLPETPEDEFDTII